MLTQSHNPGRFASGNQAAKGNRRGKPLPPHGRTLVLETIDRMLQQRANQRRLARALQRKLEQDPYGFFEKVIMPLLPRHARQLVNKPLGSEEWPDFDTLLMTPSESSTPPVTSASESSAAAGGSARPVA